MEAGAVTEFIMTTGHEGKQAYRFFATSMAKQETVGQVLP
jgi:hypothetical protein